MTRIQPVNPESATGQTHDLFQQVQSKLRRVPNLMQTLGHSPAALGGYLSLNEALSHGVLSNKDRERIALAVSEQNGCDYCLAAHSTIGEMVGLSADQVEDARRGESSDAKAGALLRFVRQVLATQGRVDDEELENFRAAGYSDAAVAEVVAHVSLNVLTNYFNNLAETEVDFPAAKALSA